MIKPAQTVCRGFAIAFKTFYFYVMGVFWIGFVAWTWTVIPTLITSLLGFKSSRFALSVLYHLIYLASGPFYLASRTRLYTENRAGEGDVVVICNHHSYIDILLLLHIFPRVCFTARRTLFRIPFLGWAMSAFGYIPHDPLDPQEALDRVGEQLNRGRYIALFPEGTRHPEGVIGPLQAGAFRLAQATGKKIQPVVVAGTGLVWPRGRFWIRRLGPLRGKVLKPVTVPPGLGHAALRDFVSEVREAMIKEHQKLGEEVRGDTAPASEEGLQPS